MILSTAMWVHHHLHHPLIIEVHHDVDNDVFTMILQFLHEIHVIHVNVVQLLMMKYIMKANVFCGR
jgi:hypothetical protein